MDKYESKCDMVLDIIRHPENYTSEQLNVILEDIESREIYRILCRIDSALASGGNINVDAEWERFRKKHGIHTRHYIFGLGNRAASITIIIFTSIVALAAGIAVTVAVADHKNGQIPVKETAVGESAVSMASETIAAKTDTVKNDMTPVIFEDEPLEVIMQKISVVYDVEFKFNNKEVASLRLYYKLDPALSLDEIVAQLNTFSQISIKRDGNVLNID